MDFGENDDYNTDLICQTSVNEYFDRVIGHIEDIVLSERFHELHVQFLEKYWSKFEDNEENKLEYMDIFNEYTSIFEAFFIEEINRHMEGFDMNKFAEELNTQEALQNSLDFIDWEIFELLYSFSNFQIFKNLLLDYRRKKEGLVQHLDLNILTTKSLHKKEEFFNINHETCSL